MTVIDLSALPRPSVVQTLSFEETLAAIEADVVARFPALAPILQLESSAAKTILEALAYREMLLRARINDAARAVLLPYAIGSDLDALASNFGVGRLVVTPATEAAPAVMESDARLRRRVQLRQEAYSTAGPAGAYVYHALTAVPTAKDATAISPQPGHVLVTLMGSADNPIPTIEQLRAARAALNGQSVRPLTDIVSVAGPNAIEVRVEARLKLYPGPDGNIVLDAARKRVEQLKDRISLLGFDLHRSALFSSLYVEGVHSIELISPAADIICDPTQCVWIRDIKLSVAGRDQ